MLNHDLILCAAEHAVAARSLVGTTSIQRKVRVGYATASQLLLALEEIGVLAPDEGTARRRVLAETFDRDAVTGAIDRAVASGAFELDGEPCAVCRREGQRSEPNASTAV